MPNSSRILVSARRMAARVAIAGLLAGGLCGAALSARAAHQPTVSKDAKAVVAKEDPEVKLGRESAEDNDKHVKLVTDAALVERVNRIGQELAAIENDPAVARTIPVGWGYNNPKQFHYTFKIVDDKDVNAYSLPGGYIYVNKGLLDYVHSDDELAGVLAHEITHAAHHHVMRLIKNQNNLAFVLPAVLAVLVATHASGQDFGNAVLGAQMGTTAVLNSFGVDAEKDADHGGMILLMHSHYNPVGLYNFMLRLAADERNHAYVDLGIYRTHPPGPERAAAAKSLLEANHITIDRTAVDPSLLVTVTMTKNGVGGSDLAELKTRGILLCRVGWAGDLSAEERGKKLAKTLNTLLVLGLQPFEVRLNHDQTRVQARNFPVLLPEDATAQGATLPDLARNLSSAVGQVNQRDQMETGVGL